MLADRARSSRLAKGSSWRGRPLEPALAIRDFLYNFCEQLILHGDSFRVVDHVADGEFQPFRINNKCDGRVQWRVCASIVVTHRLPGSLRLDQILADRLLSYPQKHLPGKLAIAGGCKQHLNLVPDKMESLRVVENRSFQDGAVGDANNPAVVQVSADPVPRF